MEYLGTDKPINKVQPIVSVCITTYNHALYIAECLDSILMQETDLPYEIIVGEDDSTDGTRDICKAYAEKHPDKIRLFLREEKDKIYINGSKTGRFNFIENFKAARGKYIAICDGDDYWMSKHKLQKQFQALVSHHDVSFVASLRNTDIKQTAEKSINWNNYSSFQPDVIPPPMPFHTSSIMFRKFDDYPKYFWEVSIGDKYLVMHLLTKGKGLILNSLITYYRRLPTGMRGSLLGTKRIYKRNWNDYKVLYKHGKINFNFLLKKFYYMRIKYNLKRVLGLTKK